MQIFRTSSIRDATISDFAEYRIFGLRQVWSANLKQYPNLTKFAKVYLSSPGNSVYNERFSETGVIYEDKRNRLLSTNAEKIVFTIYRFTPYMTSQLSTDKFSVLIVMFCW